jgi:hypothetical protein
MRGRNARGADGVTRAAAEPIFMGSLGSGGLTVLTVLTRREDGSYAMIRLDP